MKKHALQSLVIFCLCISIFAGVANTVRADISSPPEDPLTQETLDAFNPLGSSLLPGNVETEEDLSSPAGIISRVLRFGFPLAGLILFVMLVWAGFEIVAGASNKTAQDSGKQRATAAVVGFLLLFASFWIIQLLEVVFNVAIL